MAAKWKLAQGRIWRQKLEQEHPKQGKVVAIPPGMQRRYGTGTMLIPRALDVDAAMRKAGKGRLVTQSQIREKLAKESKADCSCPLATGILIRIAAEAAEEDSRAGKKRITPYWRTMREDGKLNERFPGGAGAQASRLRREGLTIRPGKGKQPPRVKDFQKYLVKL